jgi:hypothetical protein
VCSTWTAFVFWVSFVALPAILHARTGAVEIPLTRKIVNIDDASLAATRTVRPAPARLGIRIVQFVGQFLA